MKQHKAKHPVMEPTHARTQSRACWAGFLTDRVIAASSCWCLVTYPHPFCALLHTGGNVPVW